MNSSQKHHLKLILGAAMEKAIDETVEVKNQSGEEEIVEKVIEQLVRDLHEEHEEKLVCNSSHGHRKSLFNGLGGP